MMPDAHPAPASLQPSFRDNREGVRMRSLFAIGKLVHDGRQYVCRVRNISDGGIGIRLQNPPPPDARVLISLRGLPPTEAEIRWVEGEDAGLAFRRAISTEHIGADPGKMPRSPRFELDRPVELCVNGRRLHAVAIDVSLGGIKLAMTEPPPVGTIASIAIDRDGGPARAYVCWSNAVTTGLRFVVPLSTSRLAALLSQLENQPNAGRVQ